MAKRFTDSDKWKKQWFRKLSPAYKCFWHYLLDSCSSAGVWDVDFEAASFHVGEELNAFDVMEAFQKQYLPFALGKRWFLIDFVDFQYGDLKTSSNAHLAVLNALKKHGLYEMYLLKKKDQQDQQGGNQEDSGDPRRVQDKDKDKAQDKDKDQDLRKGDARGKPILPVASSEAVAHAAYLKTNRDGPSQPEYDRALKVLDVYPKRAKRDGRIIKKDLQAQNHLARKIFDSPDFPWEEAAALECHGDTPQDLGVWVMAMPDPVKLSAMRAAVATPIPQKPSAFAAVHQKQSKVLND